MRSTQFLLVITILSDVYCGIQVYDYASGRAAAKAAVIKRFINVAKIAPEPTKSVMGTVMLILIDGSDIFEKKSPALQNIPESLESIEINIDKVLSSMQGLMFSEDLMQSELKLQPLIEYQANLKAEYGNFGQLIINYGTDMDKLREELGEFLKSYKYKNIENKLSNYLNETSAPSTTLSRSFIDFAMKNKGNSSSLIRSAPNKLIYDFHIAILMKIFEGNEFLLACYELQNQLSKNDFYENNKRFVLTRSADAVEKILFSLRASLWFVYQQQDAISYNNLPLITHKIEFKNVLQLFVEYLYYLRRSNPYVPSPQQQQQQQDTVEIPRYHLTCDDADNSLFEKGDGCYGAVKNCVFTGQSCMGRDLHIQYLGTAVDYGVLSDDPDRIYSKTGNNLAVFQAKSKECENNDGNNRLDDVCACTCDQFNNPRTERYLYAGVVSAPNGFVVTGVRFRKHRRVVFLQIEVGQLLPGGFVNASSVHWQEPPGDITKNYLTFNYGLRRMLLDDLFFDDAVLTGVQFYQYFNHYMFVLRIFGRRINKPYLDGMAGETITMTSREILFLEKNIEDKIPELAPLQPNFTNFYDYQNFQNPYTIKRFPNYDFLQRNFSITYGRSNDSFNGTFIKFGPSSKEFDIAQTFVPFIDAADIIFDVKSPLAGIGLLHYTNDEHYAGYIRPFLRSLNFANNVIFFEKYLEITRESIRAGGTSSRNAFFSSGRNFVSTAGIHQDSNFAASSKFVTTRWMLILILMLLKYF